MDSNTANWIILTMPLWGSVLNIGMWFIYARVLFPPMVYKTESDQLLCKNGVLRDPPYRFTMKWVFICFLGSVFWYGPAALLALILFMVLMAGFFEMIAKAFNWLDKFVLIGKKSTR